MIREDLLEFKYYMDRLSMFMKESHGIKEQVEIFFQQLAKVNEILDEYFSELDIFELNGEKEATSSSAILDKLGAIFGCYRRFTVSVPAQGTVTAHNTDVELNDNEFALYIKCQIVKQNFNGTREELAKLYTTYEDNRKIEGALLPLTFIYVLYQTTTGASPVLNSVQCQIYWSDSENYDSQNLKELFLAGYLTIESMGIRYIRILQNIAWLGIYADALIVASWHEGDYYPFTVAGVTTYYIWHPGTGWTEQSTPGSGSQIVLSPVPTTPSDLPNYGEWHNFADANDPSVKGGYFA